MRSALLFLAVWAFSFTSAQDIIPLIDIQGEVAVSPYDNQEVTINAMVTEYFGDYWFMQDAFGAWNGLMVHDSTLLVPPNPPWWNDPRQPEVGDELTITGTIIELDGNTQMVNATLVEQTEFWLATPAGTEVTGASSQDEALEGTRIRMFSATVVTEADDDGYWVISDGVDELTCIGIDDEADPFPGDVYDVYGSSCEIDGQYYLHVGDIDVVSLNITQNSTVDFAIYPNPTANRFTVEAQEEIKEIRVFNATGELVAHTTPGKSREDVIVGSWASGNYVIMISLSSGFYSQNVTIE